MKKFVLVILCVLFISVIAVFGGCDIFSNINPNQTQNPQQSQTPLSGDELIERITEEIIEAFE